MASLHDFICLFVLHIYLTTIGKQFTIMRPSCLFFRYVGFFFIIVSGFRIFVGTTSQKRDQIWSSLLLPPEFSVLLSLIIYMSRHGVVVEYCFISVWALIINMEMEIRDEYSPLWKL